MLSAFGAWIETITIELMIGSFLALALWETLRPARPHQVSLAHRWTTNIGLQAINATLPALLAPILAASLAEIVGPVAWQPATVAETYVGAVPILVFGLLAADLYSYLFHRLSHAWFPLWRLHAVHHADIELDATTGFRHHPVQALITSAAGSVWLFALGLPVWVYAIYGGLAIIVSVAQHANVVLPPRLDHGLRWAWVTPGMHEIHHSADARDYESNYGAVFSVWDRLFGTYHDNPAAQPDLLRFGVEPFMAPNFAAPHWSLLLPLKIRRYKPRSKPPLSLGSASKASRR